MIIYLPYLVTCFALILYMGVTWYVGKMRSRHKITAPATVGCEEFERAFRVQQNTLEQMIVFLPSMWMFSILISPFWGADIGLVWVLARLLYAIGYCRHTPERMPGFLIGMLANAILLLGSLGAVVKQIM